MGTGQRLNLTKLTAGAAVEVAREDQRAKPRIINLLGVPDHQGINYAVA